jgi:hypothetical protein
LKGAIIGGSLGALFGGAVGAISSPLLAGLEWWQAALGVSGLSATSSLLNNGLTNSILNQPFWNNWWQAALIGAIGPAGSGEALAFTGVAELAEGSLLQTATKWLMGMNTGLLTFGGELAHHGLENKPNTAGQPSVLIFGPQVGDFGDPSLPFPAFL